MQEKNYREIFSRVPQQLIPLGILFIVLVVVLLVVRQLLVPETFGEYGHYRFQAVADNMGQDIMYAGYDACAECHDDIAAVKTGSRHEAVSCETCHGPGAKHADDPSGSLPDIPRKREHCELCHGYNPSRPSGFPQVIETMHNPGRSCISCHNPHNPEPPHVPDECSACHRGIASEKSVSHHATLTCATCHQVPTEHLTRPRLVRAQKPMKRTFCGRCHAKGAESPREIPRVDLSEHGERHMCWDCHYPHFPEARL